MNRRTVLAAPAAIATSTALPAVALGATIPTELDYDAIRERIALVCETFSKATFGCPEPMPADEASAAKALSNAEINETDKLIRVAHRWGASLDWLIKGDVGSLLQDARQLREKEQTERVAVVLSAEPDPTLIHARRWMAVVEERNEYCRRREDIPEENADAEWNAFFDVANSVATTAEGLEAQIRVSFDFFGELCNHDDPFDPDNYRFRSSWKNEIDGRMLRSILAGAARLAARETGRPVSYMPPLAKVGDASDFAEPDELETFLKGLDRYEKEMVLRIARPLANGDRSAAEAAYRAWAAERGRPINEGAIAAGL